MYTYVVGMSQNDRQVYTNIIGSVAGRYLSRQPHLIRMIKDFLESSALAGKLVTLSHDMGKVIGNTNIVATEGKDSIYYARQPKRTNMLRFVKNRSMEPSKVLTIVLQQDDEGNYELVNVWVGPSYPPFPDAADAVAESKVYWQTHALVGGTEPIDLQSVTRECPY